jgi:hypothetical protein
MFNFLFKRAIAKRVASMSDEQKRAILDLLEKNPDVLNAILSEVEEETKAGRDPLDALERAIKKNQDILIDIFKKEGFIK